jgi:hypothetical protein
MMSPEIEDDLAQFRQLRADFLAAHAAGDHRLAVEILDMTGELLGDATCRAKRRLREAEVRALAMRGWSPL